MNNGILPCKAKVLNDLYWNVPSRGVYLLTGKSTKFFCYRVISSSDRLL